jgi:hypothetical protein
MAPTSNSNEDMVGIPDIEYNNRVFLMAGRKSDHSMDSWYVIDDNTVDGSDNGLEAERNRVPDIQPGTYSEELVGTFPLNFRGKLADILLLIRRFRQQVSSNRIHACRKRLILLELQLMMHLPIQLFHLNDMVRQERVTTSK